jgi:methylenetetrahydrofolate dehydrogenase (NADP+) / methenyltetrahydrofolate cyclohydrolase
VATLIDGKAIGVRIQDQIRLEAEELASRGVVPGLAVVLAGDDPASQVYVRSKIKTAKALGLNSFHHLLPESASQEELLAIVEQLNADPAVHGILVQLPLPKQMDSRAVLQAIDPRKDVDGFHPVNVGALVTGAETLPPCTPAGIIEMLKATGVPLQGAEAVVVGRSNIVGKPVAMLLLAENATVTVCHSRTDDDRDADEEHCRGRAKD